VRPSFSGSSGEVRRLRLLASVSTVWVAWCVVVVGSMATLWLLEDPPAPGIDSRSTGWLLADRLSTTAICVAAVLIMAAGSKLGWRAMRSSSAVRRMMIGPLLVLGLVVLGFIPLALIAANTPAVANTKQFGSSFVIGLLTWTLLVAVTSIWWTIAIPRVLRVAGPSPDALRVPTFAAVVVSVLLLAPAGLLVAVALSTGEAWGLPTTVLSTVSTFVVVSAAAVGALSAGRGLRALIPEAARS
jgi:hypothetical protein